jgi:hypothetical protein
MAKFHRILNCQTGEVTEVPFTAEEELASSVPAPPPTVVTMRQARLALFNSGMLPAVEAAIAAMEGAPGDLARIDWEYAATVNRNDPLVVGLSAALAIDDAQLDALFTAASAL